MTKQKYGYQQNLDINILSNNIFEQSIPKLDILFNNKIETTTNDIPKIKKSRNLFFNSIQETSNLQNTLKDNILPTYIYDFHIRNNLKTNIEDTSRINPLYSIYNSSKRQPLISKEQEKEKEKKEYNEFSHKLINIIKKEDFEYGFETDSDRFVRKMFCQNADKTKNFLNQIYIDFFSENSILMAVLRIVSRFDYHEIEPQGQTMMLGVLSHEDEEIIETVVRSFESWNSKESIKYLKKIQIRDKWLESYKNDVIDDIEKFYGITN